MDIHPRKITARLDTKAGSAFTRPQPRSRPASPTKHSPASSLAPSSLRPKAKVNSTVTATVRKLSSSSSLSTSRTNNVSTPSLSRPASPLKPSWMMTNGAQPSRPARPRITAKPTSRVGMSPVQANPSSLEARQRALTSGSTQLKLPHPEDRPRSGSVIALHRALSIPDFDSSSSQTPPYSSTSAEPPVDIRRTNTPPALVKIKSKVTGLVKPVPTTTDGPALRSLSPPHAATRPIHIRARTPSITTAFSLNDPSPSAFYPITTASPAANPHRYVPRRAPSPARPFSSPTLSNEPHPSRKLSPPSKVDPASVPLPPHSPPTSALSLSSRSSVSRTSVSLNNDRVPDHQVLNLASHIRSMEQASPFLPNAETMPNTRRDRSRSKERNPRDLVHTGDSDPESDGSERQLRAEAKTNRKIADLEITNRSLLAINASLETTKNQQAKEIRDLRRKLRESRLILPPRTYKTVKSAEEEDDEDDADEDEDEDESNAESQDETFQRVRGLIDGLMESGKNALKTRSEDFRVSLTTKVLNADELRSWRGSGQRASTRNSHVDKQDADDETIRSRLSPAPVGVPDSGNTSSVESDGGPASDSPGSSSLPPITITHSL